MTATFVCRPNSHPFQERRVTLTEPVKIGRSVARAKPAANNAIFDCKVLSRNHALLWFEEGKFYLKDTKSSNGTFVNNQRLSKGSEESMPYEVNSGDIIQFGVDVVENSRKVTHGCIVSQIRLYLHNGEEAKQSDVTWSPHLIGKVPHNPVYPTIQSQDLYQLHQYLQEALHREQMLEQKLALMQRLVSDSQDTSEKGWQALIDEDKLLSRLEFLENQIQTHTKTLTEESTQKELLQLQEEKHNYETTSKETLRQVLQEKLEAVRKLSNLERSFSNTEDECSHLKEVLTKTQQELKELAEKHQQHVQESQKATEKSQETERKYKELDKLWDEEKQKQEEIKQKKVEEDEEFRKEVLETKEENTKLEKQIEELKSRSKQIDNMIEEEKPEANGNEELSELNSIEINLKENLNNAVEEKVDNLALNDITVSFKEEKIEVVRAIEIGDNPSPEEKMNIVEVPLTEKMMRRKQDDQENNSESDYPTLLKNLHKSENTVEERSNDGEDLRARISVLEELISNCQSMQKEEESKRMEAERRLKEIQDSREQEKKILTETTRELQAALSERENLLEREENLRTRIDESERLLKACDTDSISSSSEAEDFEVNSPGDIDDDIACGSLVIAKAKLKELKKKLKEKETLLETVQTTRQSSTDNSEEVGILKNHLKASAEKITEYEDELKNLRKLSEENGRLQDGLEEARRLAQDQCSLYEKAQQELQLATEGDVSELKELEGKLEKERHERMERMKEIEELRGIANQQNTKYEDLLKEKTEMSSSLNQCLEKLSELQKGHREFGNTEDAKHNQLLAEKEALLVDMQQLREKLEEQQKSIHEELQAHRTNIDQDWEDKLKAKQEEVDALNRKFSQFSDERQSLIRNGQSNNAGWKAFQVALIALAVGVAFIIWPFLFKSS